MDELIGRTLNKRYRLDQLRGQGGMGAVFKGYDLNLAIDVAIKLLHPQYADQPTFRSRFQQEAQVAARLRHPCIVNVRDFGEERPYLYIVMEFIPGDNLRELLDRLKENRQLLLVPEAVELARLVCLALHYLHQQGIFHRDIKPGNIMLRPISVQAAPRLPGAGPGGVQFGPVSPEIERAYPLPYSPVLTDLGLVKLAEGGVLTMDGTSLGTPTYMSPEQARGEPTDARSDVYSTGVLLYELTTGQPPFPIRTLMEALRFHTQEPPPRPSSLRPEIPPQVEGLILMALAKQPEHRFHDAGAMASALAQILAGARPEVTPSIPGQELSLLTLWQQSRFAPPGFRPDEVPLPSDRSQDQLTYRVLDGTPRSVTLQGAALTIGRAADSDIVIDDPGASRHHARIAYDGTNYAVTDLGSTNGTLLDSAKLLPNVAQTWSPGQVLHIGGISFHLTRAEPQVPGRPPEDRTAMVSGTNLPVEIVAETADLTVEPGGSVVARVSVLNQSTRVDHFQVRAAGIPASWVPSAPAPIYLLPGSRDQVSLTVQPPRSPQSRAGRHRLTLQAFGQNEPSRVAETTANLTVNAYHQFEAELRPFRQSGVSRGDFRVLVRNQGNADLSLQLAASDREDACRYLFDAPGLVLPAGEERLIPLQVQARSSLPDQVPRTYPFTVTAKPIEAPELARQLQGEWVRTSPSFELAVRPQRQTGVAAGTFAVQVQNNSDSQLTLQLEATDREDGCRYGFNPPQLVVPAGAVRQAALRVEAKPGAADLTPRTYAFTVKARPLEAPQLAREAQAEWVRTQPSFEITVHPQRQSRVGPGFFTLQVQNSSDSPLTLQLEAADREGGCQYALEPAQLTVPAGQTLAARLRVEPKAPLPALAPKTYYLTVTARPVESPRLSRQAQAEWEQALPNFELAVNPPKLRRRGQGVFQVQIYNRSDGNLTVQLAAMDAGGECLYTFEPAQVPLPAGGSGAATLRVRAKAAPTRGQTKAHAFAIAARPAEAPLLIRQMQAEWEQPSGRSLSIAGLVWAVLAGIGWCAAFVAGAHATAGIARSSSEALYRALESPLGSEWAAFVAGTLILLAALGLVAGLLGGLFTGVVLCLGERGFRGKQLVRVTLGWALSWTAALAGLALLLRSNPDLLQSAALWAACGGAAGLLGGWITGRAVHSARPAAGAFVIALGWAAAWAVADAIPFSTSDSPFWLRLAEWMGSRGLDPLFGLTGLFAFAGLVAGILGGLVMFLYLGRAHGKAGQQAA